MDYILLTVIFAVLLMNVASIWPIERRSLRSISLNNFLALFLFYLTMLIGFGLVYTVLQMNEHQVLLISDGKSDISFYELFQESVYFSAITLLSIGYGDVVPIGVGRWIAIVEALLGYTIPAALIVRTVIDFEKK